MTATNALTKTTNCAFRAKKWRGTTNKNFLPVLRAGSVSPTFKFVPVPLIVSLLYLAVSHIAISHQSRTRNAAVTTSYLHYVLPDKRDPSVVDRLGHL